tara:strand:+ start:217 stop:1164 length:948 start_codon:yes stop_codon:yes gene_type:complete
MADMAQTQIAREAPFLEDYRRRLMDSVFAATDKAITPQERAIAPFDAFQQAGFGEAATQAGYTYDPNTGGLTKTGLASYEPAMNLAEQTALSGIPALQQAQKQYDPSTSNYQQFFDKYQSDVTQEALKQMDQEAAKAQANLAGQATMGGTFGGSRYGVQEAELAKNLQDIKSQRIFQDLSNNFQQAQSNAMNTFEQAQARNLGVGQALGQSAQGIAGLGQLGFGLGQAGIGSLAQFGGQRQADQQARADEVLRLTTEKQNEPLKRLGFIGDILSRTPSINQTYGQQPVPYTNPLMGAIGAGISGLGTFGSIFAKD